MSTPQTSGDVTAGGASTADDPWPVRVVSTKIKQWIERLGGVWVEGQITQLSRRPGTRTAFLTLRDPSADVSLNVTCSPRLFSEAPVELTEGSRVVVWGKPSFYTGRGTFSLHVTEIRAVGIGELLARIERLKALLKAEGLFDPRLKRPLPFLPGRIGLITGRASAAERDVLSVSRRRWPEVQFEVRNTAVQGAGAVAQIVEALIELDADPTIDVIIIARGGGSVEDLLPFSDETLCRAIVSATTPVVSAIGHEPDNPVCDYVADLRAATPTDAAKRVVPDVVAERALVRELRDRSAAALRTWVTREQRLLIQLRTRPVLADPHAAITQRAEDVARLRDSARRDVVRSIDRAVSDIQSLRSRLSALGPAATLARGYAVVQAVDDDGASHVVTAVDAAPAGAKLRVRVSDGVLRATSAGPE
ncbi:exodeoxyribonuclease VII large subunit [Hoyosella rhizosphaerae]|uniref:Exodeoxyribonuclease 7 large subunit n=1 Tax=Hoyosella rhizosphaerae TaxID=1755582 RepID=A0A916XFW7_9ACTN|nr:exodeoxyribonuclease VII large subunit [Hoyosella rhizosphaerae]MBN4925654.1 exodeoxyribonuclease VII large subunit [Hoyosella rhizosphaerae]GGC68952.1 exodeoxyribonuclease 7 large subunit [Hoyosella rhizosphaerae]